VAPAVAGGEDAPPVLHEVDRTWVPEGVREGRDQDWSRSSVAIVPGNS
jgi:hypothetical protein